MMTQRPHSSIRIFKNPILERLTHVHPLTPLVLWAPVIVGLIYRSLFIFSLSMAGILAVGSLGILCWTLTEYALHRFVFHYQSETYLGQRFYFLVHGLHHEDPVDPTRLVMPPVVSIALALVFFNFFSWVLGSTWVEPFFAFFLLGYLYYDYTHFAVHHFHLKSRFGKMIKNHHMRHHYVNPETRFGVSSPVWDSIFNTLDVAEDEERTI